MTDLEQLLELAPEADPERFDELLEARTREDKQLAKLKAKTRLSRAQMRAENRKLWIEYHEHMMASHRAIADSHEAQLEALIGP